MGGAAELLALSHGKIGFTPHDRAHLNGSVLPLTLGIFHLHHGREGLAAHPAAFFINDIVFVAGFFQIHSRAGTGGAGANDTDPCVFIHDLSLLFYFVLF